MYYATTAQAGTTINSSKPSAWVRVDRNDSPGSGEQNQFHVAATENARFALTGDDVAVDDLVWQTDTQALYRVRVLPTGGAQTGYDRINNVRAVVATATAQNVNVDDLVVVGSDVYLSQSEIANFTSTTMIPTNWIELTGGGGPGASTFLALTDTPSTFGSAGQLVAVNADADGLTYVTGGGGGVPSFTETATGEYAIRRLEARQLEITIPDTAFIPASGTTINFDVGRGTVAGGDLARTGTLIANSPQTLRAGIAGNSGFDSFPGVTADLSGDVITINGPAGTYRIRMNAANTIDFDEITVNLGTTSVEVSGSTTELVITTTQAELDASTTWQEVTTDTPFWNSRDEYFLGNEVIDDNRLFKCNNPVTSSSPATQHITSDQIIYISNPIDNADNFLRFTFNRDETVVAGVYRYRFFDNDGNVLEGNFAHNHIENDSGNAIGINMSSNRWLINYTNITQTMGTLPTAFTEFTNPDADIQNGSAANTNPAVTPEHWTEIASVDDTRILDHDQLAPYEPGEIVTDPVSTSLFRCIDGVLRASGGDNNFTNIRDARLVDDNGTVSLAIRFIGDVSPRDPNDSTNGDYPWTLHANIHSDGSEVTAMFTADDVVDDTSGSNILTMAADEWLIRVDSDLVTTGNFPRTVSNDDNIDFLDVSHASLHSGSFNPRPAADPEHWERIGSALPTPPGVDGNYELLRTTPRINFGPDNTAFVTNGSADRSITTDPTGNGVTRIGPASTALNARTNSGPALNAGEVSISTAARNGTLATSYPPVMADTDVGGAGSAFNLLFDASEPGANALRTLTFNNLDPRIMISNRNDANNWWLADVESANRRVLNGNPGDGSAFFQFGIAILTSGTNTTFDVDGMYDIVYGPRATIFTDGIPQTARYSWRLVGTPEIPATGIYEATLHVDASTASADENATLSTATAGVAFQMVESVNTIGATLNTSNWTVTLPAGQYLIQGKSTNTSNAAAGANRNTFELQLMRHIGGSSAPVDRSESYLRSATGTTIAIGNTTNSFFATRLTNDTTAFGLTYRGAVAHSTNFDADGSKLTITKLA